MLVHLLYVSEATRPLDSSALDAILRAADKQNRDAEITGVLLYRGGLFAQLLEGPEPAIMKTFERIRADSRHRRVDVLLVQPAVKRIFTRWAMMKEELTPEIARALGQALGSRSPQYYRDRLSHRTALRTAFTDCLARGAGFDESLGLGPTGPEPAPSAATGN